MNVRGSTNTIECASMTSGSIGGWTDTDG